MGGEFSADTANSLVNNAGVALEARTPAVCHLTDESVWDTTMTVNAKSVFLGCKYALAQMLEQPPHSSGDRGWIVNISSIMGIIGALDNRKRFPDYLMTVCSTYLQKLPISFLLCVQGCCE